jgi:hypothetical protein
MSEQALLKVLATMIASVGFLGAVAQAQEQNTKQACPHEIGWTPTGEELKKILSDHQQWLERWRTADYEEEWATHNPQGRANLCNANPRGLTLNNVNLRGANLNAAKLDDANLSGANLSAATLTGANLSRADLKDTQLAYADLTNAIYAPASPPPNAYVAGIRGLETVTFPQGHELGLVQLRKLLQDAGLRDQERETTYAIEAGRTTHARNSLDRIDDWRRGLIRVGEGVFRRVFFDLTTSYGLRPGRALAILVGVWAVAIPFYCWAIWDRSWWSPKLSGIYQIRPKDRIVVTNGNPTLTVAAEVERLHTANLALALGWSAWFSLLSAFHIGFREFSVGTWLCRGHPHQFTLEATGGFRSISGLQSLISVYLLAMWVLTYFGRPFQ